VELSELPLLQKGDEVKVLFAAYIKGSYPMENKRIRELLSMGHPTFISRCRSLVESDAAQRKTHKKLCRHLKTE
jgi:hypothetical protein